MNTDAASLEAPWIGVGLDGTLALFEGNSDLLHIGDPIPAMVDLVKKWVAQGRRVKVVTHRVGPLSEASRAANVSTELVRTSIMSWLNTHVGVSLEVTHEIDFDMVEFWDVKAVGTVMNKGEPRQDQSPPQG